MPYYLYIHNIYLYQYHDTKPNPINIDWLLGLTPTFSPFLVDVEHNHSHLKLNNLPLKCETPTSLAWSTLGTHSYFPTEPNKYFDTSCGGVWGAPRAAMDQTSRTTKRLRHRISTQILKALGIWVPSLIYPTFPPFLVDMGHNHSHFIFNSFYQWDNKNSSYNRNNSTTIRKIIS